MKANGRVGILTDKPFLHQRQGGQNAMFHENGVSNSYPFNNKIPNLKVSKIRIGCPKDAWISLAKTLCITPGSRVDQATV